jgi:hypothetical protein
MNKYEPILKEIASGMLEVAEIKPNYSNDAFLDAILIFQTVLIDKLFDNQNFDNMPLQQRDEMVEACGNDLIKLIHTYTGLDTVKLIDDYGK